MSVDILSEEVRIDLTSDLIKVSKLLDIPYHQAAALFIFDDGDEVITTCTKLSLITQRKEYFTGKKTSLFKPCHKHRSKLLAKLIVYSTPISINTDVISFFTKVEPIAFLKSLLDEQGYVSFSIFCRSYLRALNEYDVSGIDRILPGVLYICLTYGYYDILKDAVSLENLEISKTVKSITNNKFSLPDLEEDYEFPTEVRIVKEGYPCIGKDKLSTTVLRLQTESDDPIAKDISFKSCGEWIPLKLNRSTELELIDKALKTKTFASVAFLYHCSFQPHNTKLLEKLMGSIYLFKFLTSGNDVDDLFKLYQKNSSQWQDRNLISAYLYDKFPRQRYELYLINTKLVGEKPISRREYYQTHRKDIWLTKQTEEI